MTTNSMFPTRAAWPYDYRFHADMTSGKPHDYRFQVEKITRIKLSWLQIPLPAGTVRDICRMVGWGFRERPQHPE